MYEGEQCVCDHAAPRINRFGVELIEKHVKYLWSAMGAHSIKSHEN